MQTGQIFPSKNGSLLKKKKEKSEAERNDKSMALSKLDELSQVIHYFIFCYWGDVPGGAGCVR